MIGCLRTRVREQPIIALYFESETVLQFYNLEARPRAIKLFLSSIQSTPVKMPKFVCVGGGGVAFMSRVVL